MNINSPNHPDRNQDPISQTSKICLLGGFAVGKTSLVCRYLHNEFSEKYYTTVGVKIDTKTVSVYDKRMRLVLWDCYGEDQFQTLQSAYLRGASGYLLVADASRHDTLERAIRIQRWVEANCEPLPFILLLNKADLDDYNAIDKRDFLKIGQCGWRLIPTSAKTGQGVEYAFKTLAEEIVEHSGDGGESCRIA